MKYDGTLSKYVESKVAHFENLPYHQHTSIPSVKYSILEKIGKTYDTQKQQNREIFQMFLT